MNALTKFADDLTRAGQLIEGQAAVIVHQEAAKLEASVRQFDGTSTQVVVTYPTPTSAHLQGQDTFGVTQVVSPLSAIDSIDVGAAADQMAADLAAAGARLITHG